MNKEVIIMLMGISLINCILLLSGCANPTGNISNQNVTQTKPIEARIKNVQRGDDLLIFYNITDGKDTMLVYEFRESLYENKFLNTQGLDWGTFTTDFLRKALNNETIRVSEEYYISHEKFAIKPVAEIDSIYVRSGLDDLLSYINKYPINRLSKEYLPFIRAAYILWTNDIYVRLSEEVFFWYIDYNGYR